MILQFFESFSTSRPLCFKNRGKNAHLLVSLALLAGFCQQSSAQPAIAIFTERVARPAAEGQTLVEARKNVTTVLTIKDTQRFALPKPPASLFVKVQYPSPVGTLSAFMTPLPKVVNPAKNKAKTAMVATTKRPAIIWLTGGDSNTLSDFWLEGTPGNDQSGAAYRKADIVMLFPTLRGGNIGNPGTKEALFGEVDDVLAAADFLAAQPGIDPARIYLGGHSTGGTLALLSAQSSDRFCGVFAFGPVAHIETYQGQLLPVNFKNYPDAEARMRSPIYWMNSIRSNVYVLEGTKAPSNTEAFAELKNALKLPIASFVPVRNANHFSILGPANAVIAQKILKDTARCDIALNAGDISVKPTP